MMFTIMVTDLVFKFRLGAIAHDSQFPQHWVLDVPTLVHVSTVLHDLGFIDEGTATRMVEASTTIVPLHGLPTMPLTDLATIVSIADPEFDDVSPEAEEGYALIVKGETTEEHLAASGFKLSLNGPIQ